MLSISNWADEVDEEEFEIEIATTKKEPATKTKPDYPAAGEGEKIVKELKIDPDTGAKFTIFRTFKLEKKLVSKGVIERKSWAKFGKSKGDAPGPTSATTVVADEVQMQFLKDDKNEDGMDDLNNPFAKLQAEGKGFVRCRHCQENHFSAKCPYKDQPGFSDLNAVREAALDFEEKKPVDSQAKPGIFVPPARRGGDQRGEKITPFSAARKDDATIRVSNLPESMSETDMQELCTPFGKIDRIFLAKDKATGVCKGFAFVTYQTREFAYRALKYLNGYGYDHLILNVEWSKPTS